MIVIEKKLFTPLMTIGSNNHGLPDDPSLKTPLDHEKEKDDIMVGEDDPEKDLISLDDEVLVEEEEEEGKEPLEQ